MKRTFRSKGKKDVPEMKSPSKWPGSGNEVLKSAAASISKASKGVGSRADKSRLMKSVGTRLFLIIFLSIMICVGAVGIFSYNTSRAIIETKVADASVTTITQTAGKLDLMMSNYEASTMTVLLDETIQNSVRDLSLSSGIDDYERFQLVQNIDSRFQNFMHSNSKTIVGGMLLPLNDTLQPVVAGGSRLNVEEAEATDWYKAAVELDGRVHWIPTSPNGLSGDLGKATFGLAKVIKSMATNDAAFVMLLEFDYEQLNQQLESISLGEGSRIRIVNADSGIIYGSEEEVGQLLDIELPGDSQSGSIHADHNGEEVVVPYQKLAVSDWYLLGTLPVGELVKDANEIRNASLITLLFAALLAIGIGFLVIRMIAVPLTQLRNLMNEGEKGNLTVRSTIKKSDEIGQLARSFNQMMEQITVLVNQTNRSAAEVLQTAENLSDASRKTAVSAKEIAVATEEIANGATSLAVEAERGSELTDRMGDRMAGVNDAGSQMAESAAEVERASEQGTQYMTVLIEKTGMTEEMTRNMVEKVDRLKDSTRSIRKILEVLNNVAKQTNILSLNATIEAARAGTAGRGFMVVADEIRKLADQSRQSIDVVAQITDTIQREIDDTVSVLSEAYPIFQEQIESVKEANQIFLSVQGQMSTFVNHLETVQASVGQLGETQNVLTEAMSNVSAVAQQSSATSEEVASLSNEQLSIGENLVELSNKLETVSSQLKETLSRFRTDNSEV